jgi:hypothetical protein
MLRVVILSDVPPKNTPAYYSPEFITAVTSFTFRDPKMRLMKNLKKLKKTASLVENSSNYPIPFPIKTSTFYLLFFRTREQTLQTPRSGCAKVS